MTTDTPSLKEQPQTRRGMREVGRIVSANERAAKALKVQRTHLGKRLRKYGMTVDEWERLMWEQEGACAICRAELATFRHEGEVACVDHDHSTGTVRGLLCYACNAAIGFFRDDHDTMERAIQYLLRILAASKPPHFLI